MIAALRHCLAAPGLLADLRQLAAGAPAAAPLSLSTDLPGHTGDLLAALPASSPFWYRAKPASGLYQLGLGHALQIGSAGPHRFAALDRAYAGFRQDWRHNGQALAFTGFAFGDHGGGPLPNALLAIPAILLERQGERCRVTFSTPAGQLEQAPSRWAELLAPAGRTAPRPLKNSRENPLTAAAWTARVQAALRAIGDGRLAKVVLSRQRRIEADDDFHPPAILAALRRQQPESLIYAYGDGQHCFLGATPERLLSRRGQRLETDALAGTAWPGSQALDSRKNRHEQSLVSHAIVAALAPLCAEAPGASLADPHSAGLLSHLRSRISARSKPGVTLFELLHALHPTPAVGGYPTAAALDWLAAHDEQRSGWYSGGFGILQPNGDGEIAVALRSALIHGRVAELQAGAGIVAGSDPAAELAETEAKMATLLDALAADEHYKNGTSG